jgi:spore coat polysaccharide biosynthesis protein SpsF
MTRVIASIEARMGSTRFPGKVLADVCGQPALSRLVRRLRRSRAINGIILATTTSPKDDLLAQWARHEDIPVHRGSEEDVLQRVVDAHRSMQNDVIVEVTGDCILLDPEIIDMGIETFLQNDCDVVTTVRKETFPQGMDVQVFRYQDLDTVARTEADPAVREHVSLYFYEHPERYRIIHLFAPERWKAPELRLMLDYPEDLKLITEIYRRLEPVHGDAFGLEEIMGLLRKEPALAEINRHCTVKPVR